MFGRMTRRMTGWMTGRSFISSRRPLVYLGGQKAAVSDSVEGRMVCSRQRRSFQGIDSHGRPDGWTEGRQDGWTTGRIEWKLHFIPTSAATVRPASGEASFVRFQGSFIGPASGEASFHRLHTDSGEADQMDGFRGSFIAQLQGRLHSVGLTLAFLYRMLFLVTKLDLENPYPYTIWALCCYVVLMIIKMFFP